MLEDGRDCIECSNKELISWDKIELNEWVNWLLNFISSTVQDELRQNSVKEKASLVSDYSNSDQDSTRGKNVASTVITTASTTVIFSKFNK